MSNDRKVNHMEDMKLGKLIEKRKDWVRLSKENSFDFNSILAGLYNDPSHFIYEILQNAEDEGAKKIRFELFEDRLDAYHNGKDFDLKDIDGITGIGISKKKDDLTAIGKFGVGFKSVFAVTETPYIFSGKYKIKIRDFVIPSAVNSNEQINGTLIRLPFNHRLRSREQVFNLVFEKLANLSSKTLLFLKNIEVIKWQTPSLSGNYSKSSKYFQKIKNTKKVIIKSSDIAEEYIVIEKPINIGSKKIKVEVAYKLDKDKRGKKTIVQEHNSKLVVFFPTDKPTYLNFLIQGPYRTTPNRENIPLDDEQNEKIIEETGNLVAESLPIIKDLGYLNVNFLSLLPINKSEYMDEQIYPVIYQKVKEKLLSEKLLLTSDHKYTKADNSLLARGKELTEFLDNKDLRKLFSKHDWLDANITYDKTRELRDYFIDELKIEEVDFENFASKITTEFIQEKTDKWMLDFYKRLLGQNSLWNDSNYPPGILRAKPIIRLETGEHIAPFNDMGEIQVYLPAKIKSKYKTVKVIFTKDKNSLKFLKALGITEPSLVDEIKEYILPKYKTGNHTKDDEYIEDFEKLLKAYETIPSDKKDEFVGKLSEIHFVDSFNNITGEYYLRKPSEVYLGNPDLKEYFKGLDSVYFVSNELYKKFGKEKLGPFLKELGIEDKPRRIEIQGNLPDEEKKMLRNGDVGTWGNFSDEKQIDYEYESLEKFINKITTEKSFSLWKLLLKNIEQKGQRFFKGEYRWFFRTQHSRVFDAKFLKTLRLQAWLIDKNNNFKKPCEIAFSELSSNYIKKSPSIDTLKDALEFKSEIINQLPKDKQKMLEILDREGITPEKLKEILREAKMKTSEEEEKTWVPKYEPDTSNTEIIDLKPNEIITPDLTGQGDRLDIVKDEELIKQNKESTDTDAVKTTTAARKAIGKWGEKFVYRALKEKYQKIGSIIDTDFGFRVKSTNNELFEIVWLNKHSDKGKGCDFVIKQGKSKIEYIEVKSKVGTEAELVSASGTQWDFARSLFDRKEGDKYSFYVVTNTGRSDAKIRSLINPIKLWREGKLYAHPVNFKL